MAWKDLEKEKPKITNSIDGYVRSAEEEQILNQHFANGIWDSDGKSVPSIVRTSSSMISVCNWIRIWNYIGSMCKNLYIL